MREEVKIQGTTLVLKPSTVDTVTWMGAYAKGIREPRYPVPAHSYITLITPHSVEMVVGVMKTYHRKYTHIDCDCVFYATDYKE